jgi:DNA-binding NarL/FixJ family response regulator
MLIFADNGKPQTRRSTIMRILIAADDSLFREGLGNLISEASPNASILQTDSWQNAMNILADYSDIDMLLIDPTLGDVDWRRCLADVFNHSDGYKIVLLSPFRHFDDMQYASSLGTVFGCLPQHSPPRVIASALGLLLSGTPYHPPMTGSLWPDGLEGRAVRKLSPRQKEALHYLAQGLANKQIAYSMSISEATVKLHVNALLRNLNVRNRTQAVVVAQRYGFLVG